MTRPHWLPALLLSTALSASCAGRRVDPFVAGMAEAMGGVEAIEQSPTLLIEADGEAYYLGENRAPDTDLPVFETRFRQAFDWADRRFRKEELRLPTFLTGSAGLRQTIAGLDGDVAYDIGGDQRARRARADVAANRRAELLHHPLGLVRAALAAGASVRRLPPRNGQERAEITTAGGSVQTVTVDSRTRLPASIASAASHPLLGDIVAETSFDAWAPVGPLMLPTRITERLDDVVVERIHAVSQTLNVDPEVPLPPAVFRAFAANARLIAPPALAAEAPPDAPPLVVQALADGVWRIGAAQYWSVLVELPDHLVLIEAPIDDARTDALLAEARTLRPDKAVTQVVVTHHHFDHIGGVRAAVAAGLTLFVRGGVEPHASGTASRSARSRDEADFLLDLLARTHTRVPDRLAKQPMSPRIVRVGESLALNGADRRARESTLVLYPIHGSQYADTLLMAYLPKPRLLVEADVYSPPPPGRRGEPWYPFAANLLENIRRLKLRVDRIVPLHGPVVPLSELEDAAGRRPPAANGTS